MGCMNAWSTMKIQDGILDFSVKNAMKTIDGPNDGQFAFANFFPIPLATPMPISPINNNLEKLSDTDVNDTITDVSSESENSYSTPVLPSLTVLDPLEKKPQEVFNTYSQGNTSNLLDSLSVQPLATKPAIIAVDISDTRVLSDHHITESMSNDEQPVPKISEFFNAMTPPSAPLDKLILPVKSALPASEAIPEKPPVDVLELTMPQRIFNRNEALELKDIQQPPLLFDTIIKTAADAVNTNIMPEVSLQRLMPEEMLPAEPVLSETAHFLPSEISIKLDTNSPDSVEIISQSYDAAVNTIADFFNRKLMMPETIKSENTINTELIGDAVYQKPDGDMPLQSFRYNPDSLNRSLTVEGYTATIKVYPPDLGQVTAEILVNKGMAELTLTADNLQVKHFIEANLQQLRDSFQGTHMELAQISVQDNLMQEGNSSRQNRKPLFNYPSDQNNSVETLPIETKEKHLIIDTYA